MLDGRVRILKRLEAEFYEETPESRSSSRGLAESSIVGVTFDRYNAELLKLELQDKTYFVPRAVLRAALNLKETT